MILKRQIPMTDPRTFAVLHHSAADEHDFGLDGFWAEYQKRNEGYQLVLTEDHGLPAMHEKPFTEVNGVQVAQEAPDDVISNGVYGLNLYAYNICCNGNFEIEAFPQAVEDELVQVLIAKCREWGWTKADVAHRIITHKAAGLHYVAPSNRYMTQCPGKNFIAKLPAILVRVAAALDH